MPPPSPFLLALLSASALLPGDEPAVPSPPGFGPPRGFPLEVAEFAPAGLVGHPIGLTVDDQGRVYTAETRRYSTGVRQSRGDLDLEDRELRVRNLSDFRAELLVEVEAGRQVRPGVADARTPDEVFRADLTDEVARYDDLDGDGVAERRVVVAAGFGDWYSGPAADVLAADGGLYLACIPDLWLLADEDGDGAVRGAERRPIASGLGILWSYLGHDLHGLLIGPDGRLWFSLGDRSYAVETPGGAVLEGRTGAIFRCGLDGRGLEVVATGLRNPQDLAFDDYGDLYTGDNNSDMGDRARLVRVLEGMDAGWRLSLQRAFDGNAWLRESMWRSLESLAEERGRGGAVESALDPARPAWCVPPLFHPTGQGPAGLAAYPGLGLPERYRGHLLLAHCAAGGGFVQSFRVVEDGAFGRVEDFHEFLEPGAITGPSDLDFAPDGRLLVTNWGSGWNPNPDASLHSVSHPESLADPRLHEARRLLAGGVGGLPVAAQAALLAHPHRAVRMRAQFALARGGAEAAAALCDAARDPSAPLLARLHATWALGQRRREGAVPLDERGAADATLRALLADGEPRLREQALRLGAEFLPQGEAEAQRAFVAGLADPAPRVRAAAAHALAGRPAPAAVPHLLRLAEHDADRDPALRHACVLALAACADVSSLEALTGHPSRAVRLAATLALRRRAAPEILAFLHDADLQVASEAARAIYDLRLAEGFEPLAAELDAEPPRVATAPPGAGARAGEALLRRAVLLNLRLGGPAHAARLLRFAADARHPEEYRRLALRCLGEWDAPAPKEGVWFDWWPASPRPPGVAAAAWREGLATGTVERLFAGPGATDALREAALLLDNGLRPDKPAAELFAVLGRPDELDFLRLDALRHLHARGGDVARDAIATALASGAPRLAGRALRLLAGSDAGAALAAIDAALETGAPLERQEAVGALEDLLETLPPESGSAARERARVTLLRLVERLARGALPADLELDVLEAAERRREPPFLELAKAYRDGPLAQDPLGRARLALEGGDPRRGEDAFFRDATAQCLKCHVLAGRGGTLGPDLTGIGARRDRRALLRALAEPQAEIAAGYGAIAVTLRDGRQLAGLAVALDGGRLGLLEGDVLHVLDARDVAARTSPISSMPPMLELLGPRLVRDLVAFLATCTEGEPAGRGLERLREAAPPARAAPATGEDPVAPIRWIGLAWLALTLAALIALRTRAK